MARTESSLVIAAAQLLRSLAVLAGCTAAPAAAQQSHTIRGVVRDTALLPIPGVEVVLLAPRQSVLTDTAGRFRFDGVPAGMRQLLIRRIGFMPVRPSVRVPQSDGDSMQAILLPAAQNLPALIVESRQPGIRGVVGDTAYHALPGTLVELLGARRADTTDEQGRFGFEDLRQRHYVLRVSRIGYVARLISVDLGRRGQEYSIFLDPYRPGKYDWANSADAANALSDLASRLATEPQRTRMTRADLDRYGTLALCDIPRLGLTGRREEPAIILRGSTWQRYGSLCAWSADEVDLLEWGVDPCKEATKTIALVLSIYCGPTRGMSFGNIRGGTGARSGYVVIWPRD